MTSQPAGLAETDVSYEAAVAAFRLDDVEAFFTGGLADGVNACVELCDRYAVGDAIALEYESHAGDSQTMTFADLRERASRFAGVLSAAGVRPGDVVAGFLPRTPELLTTMLGTWRAGAAYQPLFTAFGPKAVESRIATSGAKLIVTDDANRPKLGDVVGLPQCVVAQSAGKRSAHGDIDFHTALAAQSPDFAPVMRRAGDLFLMMSTSGTTGAPKGVPVPLRALASFYAYMRDAVDLRAGDVYWNIADPGWAYGLYYAVIGPLAMGHATTFYDGPFSAETTYRIIAERGVTNLAGSPTAFRLLMAAKPELAAPVKGKLRVVSSAGEALNPEVIRWFAQHLGVVVHDHYGQTELGMLVNNHHRLRHTVEPGSAGFAMPGYRVAVLDEAGRELPPNVPGLLAVDIAHSPLLWFEGYANEATPAIAGGYYRTGDTVELEPDGRISFVGRADDVITSSGYRIGPFDVESALIEHPAVIEAAVIGKPDPERTEIVKTFVVLAAGYAPSSELDDELRNYVKQRLSAHAYPREIEFVEFLPKTPSGKVQRFILRRRETETP